MVHLKGPLLAIESAQPMSHRPRGDITTLLDLTDRDSQDNTYFPLDTERSWFHRESPQVIHPTTMSVQEFVPRGPAEWGQKFTFELDALPAGDLLQSAVLQIQLGSWYNATLLKRLSLGELTTDPASMGAYWTYANSLGTALIDSAELIVGDQCIERITGEWIRVFYHLSADLGSIFGIAADAIGAVPHAALAVPAVYDTAFHPRRPFPTENGHLHVVLPFFFLRTRLQECFPLVACNEGQIRIDVKLRSFEDMVRRTSGFRSSADDTPLGKTVPFLTAETQTLAQPPAFADVRLVTCAALVGSTLRSMYLRRPFEQLTKLVRSFHFEEPLKYLVSKSSAAVDHVDIQLPLELNHPTTELVWVFRRKDVRVNNEWANFSPAISAQYTGALASAVYPAWLREATVRVNGSEVITAPGEWFREHIARVHRGGYMAHQAHVYGYSFSLDPDAHQPTGSANMSRATSVTLRLSVRTPIPAPATVTAGFDPATVGGWEVFVFAVHYNWLRFENGMCQRLFSD